MADNEHYSAAKWQASVRAKVRDDVLPSQPKAARSRLDSESCAVTSPLQELVPPCSIFAHTMVPVQRASNIRSCRSSMLHRGHARAVCGTPGRRHTIDPPTSMGPCVPTLDTASRLEENLAGTGDVPCGAATSSGPGAESTMEVGGARRHRGTPE